ncbi:MAG: hypothetical protein IKY97_03085 [Mailhella sp.]|nr:hypothetical protein [Mailhella sp.]
MSGRPSVSYAGRFSGNLLVLYDIPRPGKKPLEKCWCFGCQSLCVISRDAFCKGATSCGCQHLTKNNAGAPRKLAVEPGQQFGRLSLVKEVEHAKGERRKVLCRCECGGERIVSFDDLRRGRIRSCGCMRKDNARSVAASRKKEDVCPAE